MEIHKHMKREVISIKQTASIGDAAALFVQHHIGTLPVVDDNARLVGLLQLRDVLSLVMPDFVRLVEDFDFVQDFGALETRQPSQQEIARPVREVMQPPIAVDERSGLLRVFSLLHSHHLLDLPVIDSQQVLVGIASRVDVGTALLQGWFIRPEGEAE